MINMRRSLATMLALTLALFLPTAVTAEESLFSDKDLTVSTVNGATPIVLDGESVTIDTEGAYVVSGEIGNGSLRVSLVKEGTVYLLLNGVTIHNDAGAALYTENCKKVVLTLADGTVNTFSQGATENEDESGAIMSRDDLTINGTGALVVNGMLNDGINCRDSFKMVSGNVSVTAVDDGIVGKDAVIVGGGTLTIAAAHDGVKATNDEDSERGYVTLAGGDITITTTRLDSAAGGLTDSAMDDAANDAGTPPEGAPGDMGGTPPEGAPADMGGRGERGGGRGGMGGSPWDMTENSTGSTSSAKGVKAITTVTVSGGNLTIDSADDCLHGANVVISDGVLSLASGDDGVHADDTLTISGGTVNVTRSYEGLEAAHITIAGGDIDVTATDDGMNGAGGNDAEETGTESSGRGGRGFDRFSSSTGDVTITSGTLRVTAQGDGIDVNGSLTMSGGQVYVNGPSNSGNGALDYDGDFTMTGGTLVAVGASGMAMGVSAPSVPGVLTTANGGQGTLTLTDGAGHVLITMDTSGSYNSVALYSDLLTDGGEYSLSTSGETAAVTVTTEGARGSGFGRR